MTALHGFLGLPSDWDPILPESLFGPVWKPNWLAVLSDAASLSPSELATGVEQSEHRTGVGPANCKPQTSNFLRSAEDASVLPLMAQRLNEIHPEIGGDVLLGYSMGGRIALHMLIADRPPFRWRKAVIVSASPGIASEAERVKRRVDDCLWAERFRLENWSSLMKSWGSQAVFSSDRTCERHEGDFDRNELAAALRNGSVGAQEDLRPALSHLEVPILWLAGERDAKYCSLAEECADLNPRFHLAIIGGAGHRAPWTCPEAFQAALRQFSVA